MPYMTPAYPENIRLLGASTWEEIEAQHTHRQTDHRNSTPFRALCMWLIADFLYPSLARFAHSAWIKKLMLTCNFDIAALCVDTDKRTYNSIPTF